MNLNLKEIFQIKWKKYFKNAELPITFYYSDQTGGALAGLKPRGHNCLIAELKKVRKGRSIYYNKESLGCSGAKKYLGFSNELRPGFEYFLSCGNSAIEGERYIKSPRLVKEFLKNHQEVEITKKHIVFKRWDKLAENDHPEVIIFFATPDIISALFTLANFDQSEPNSTTTPFGAGCSSIVHYPYLEIKNKRQRAVIGMFDISARPYIEENLLSFAVPFKKFKEMVSNMDESFLITHSWELVKKRM